MRFIDRLKPQFLFKTDKAPDLRQYIGRKVHIPGVEEPVTIKTIVGNIITPTYYEINGEHLIGMLRFHAQMLGDKSITEEEFKQFEEMVLEAERMPEKKSILEVPNVKDISSKSN